MRHPLNIAAITLFLLMFGAAPSASAQQDHITDRSSPLLVEAGSAALGSAAGLGAGLWLADSGLSCATVEVDCGLGEAIVGAALGSVVGSTLGAQIGGRLSGGDPWLPGTVMGASAGVLFGALVAQLAGPDSEAVFIIGFSTSQGTLAALAGR